MSIVQCIGVGAERNEESNDGQVVVRCGEQQGRALIRVSGLDFGPGGERDGDSVGIA